jgi:hypothetical protein
MKVLTAILSLVFFCATVHAQSDKIDSLLKANAYTLSIDNNGNLAGNGAPFLIKKLAGSQFVLIGENHNSKEIPEFTTALFKALHTTYGFDHLALEQDPPMMRKVSAKKYRGNRDSVFSLARRYPYGFTFITDEELKMIADVSQYNVRGNSVWGLDQSFGLTHVVEPMVARAKGSPRLDSLLASISRDERIRDLDNKTYKKYDLAALAQFKTGDENNEADFGIRSLQLSDSIYYLMNHKRTYEGCELREAYMKSRFVEEYKQCVKAGEQNPKVLLKLGNSHVMDGFEPNTGVLDLGTFVKQFAIQNGTECLSIYARIYRNDSSDWNYNLYEGKEAMNLFARNASINEWTLFDLRPLKSLYYNSGLKGILGKEDAAFLERYYLSFDFLLLIGNGGDGTFDVCKCSY